VATAAAFGLGGNLGAVEATLAGALRGLAAAVGPLRVASLYRGPAVSPLPQPDFLNTAALVSTDLPPAALLAIAKALELQAGRRRGERWGPRPLDVDLLLVGDIVSEAPELTLPHPRLAERRFVLEPLAEIAPDLPVPPSGTPVRALLDRLPGGPPLRRLAWTAAHHA